MHIQALNVWTGETIDVQELGQENEPSYARLFIICKDNNWDTNLFCLPNEKAGYKIGLCDYDGNRKCCTVCDKQCLKDEAASQKNDKLCARLGGQCMHETNYCNGYYSASKCGGSTSRGCCIPTGSDCRLLTYTNSRVVGLFLTLLVWLEH